MAAHVGILVSTCAQEGQRVAAMWRRLSALDTEGRKSVMIGPLYGFLVAVRKTVPPGSTVYCRGDCIMLVADLLPLQLRRAGDSPGDAGTDTVWLIEAPPYLSMAPGELHALGHGTYTGHPGPRLP